MELLLNELDTVRREELRGREYLVAPVTPMKAMRLDKGYVPEKEIRKSKSAWNGTPVTLNHPADADGNIVSANAPAIAERTQLGMLYNVDTTDGGEMLEGEVWIDEMKANHIGDDASSVVERLDNGDAVSVSTSYYGDPLDPGEYDGEYREQVMGNLRPDHLALLPNKTGRCSIDDGCVAGDLAANSIQVLAANKSVAGVSFAGTESGKLDRDEIDKDDHTLSDHYLFGSGDDKADFSYPVVDANGNLRKGNVESAYEVGASGEGVTESELHSKLRKLNKEWSEGNRPIAPKKLSSNTDDPVDSGEGSNGQSADSLVDSIRSVIRSLAGNFGESDEHPRDGSGKFMLKDADIESLQDGDEITVTKTSGEAVDAVYHRGDGSHLAISTDNGEARRLAPGTVKRIDVVSRMSDNTMDREHKIDALVENTDLKRKSLEPMGDACLSNVYDHRTDGDGGEGDNDNGTQSSNDADDDDGLTADDVREIVESAISANEEQGKREGHIDTIMANSDSYDRDDLEETPLSTLETIENDVTSSVNYGALGGGSPSASSNDSDDTDVSAFEPRANARIENEGDD